MSQREALADIISMAQQARPKVAGQRLDAASPVDQLVHLGQQDVAAVGQIGHARAARRLRVGDVLDRRPGIRRALAR